MFATNATFVQDATVTSAGSASGSIENTRLYTAEQVIRQFEGLLPALDLKDEIEELGCGLNSFFNKGRTFSEFTAMSVALWKLALDSSFPHESEQFFNEFLSSSTLLGKRKKREKLIARINIYRDLLAAKKHEDFTPISGYISENLSKDTKNQKVLRLKLSLTIRKLYQLIFDHLI